MKAQELRIGNIIEIKNGLQLPLELKDFQSSFFEESINNENIKPILLTEEWLLKFGFESYTEINLDAINGSSWGGKHKEFDMEIDNGIVLIFWENESIGSSKYVHQLQNLYFDLTGEELTIIA